MERIPKSQVLRKALQEIVTGAVIEGNPMDELFHGFGGARVLETGGDGLLSVFLQARIPQKGVRTSVFGHI